jgi:hypothetical protein
MELKFPAGPFAATFTGLVLCLKGHAVSRALPLTTSLNAYQPLRPLVTLLQRRPSYRFATHPNQLVTTVETELRRIRDDEHDVVNPLWPSLPGQPPTVGATRAAV